MLKKLLLALVLGGVGFLLNLWPFPVTRGVDVILGGIATLACAVLAGPYWGALSALIAFLPTLNLWEQPGLIVFVLEAAVVGMLVEKKERTPTTAVTLYWLCGGMLAYALLHLYLSPTSPAPLSLIVLVRALNSLFNVLILEVLFIVVPLQQYVGKTVTRTLRHEIFVFFAIFALTPIVVIAYREGQWAEKKLRADVERELQLQKVLIAERAKTFIALNTEKIRNVLGYEWQGEGDYPRLAKSLYKEIGATLAEVHVATPGECHFHDAANRLEPGHEWMRDLRQLHPLPEAELSRPLRLPPPLSHGVASLWPLGDGKYLVTVWDLWGALRLTMGESVTPNFVVFDRHEEVLLSTVETGLDSKKLLALVGKREGLHDLGGAPGRQQVRAGLLDSPFAYYADLPELKWKLLMFWPGAVVGPAVSGVYFSYLWVLLIGIGAAVFFSFLAARKYHQPISELASYAQKLGKGDFGAPLDVQTGIREVDTLIDNYRSLKDSLERSSEEMHRSVAQVREQRRLVSKAYEELRGTSDQLNRAQAQLIEAEKLAALGEMVRGIAHELNNPLTAVIGFSELLLKYGGERSDRNLQTILDSAHRCEAIVRSLLDFSRQQESVKSLIHLKDVIQKVTGLMERQVKVHGIEFHVAIPENLPRIYADPRTLEQVFLNLVQNAYDALNEKTAGSRQLSIGAYRSGDSAYVVVADTGPGIPAHIRPKIFDPFFTTKPVGQGTGLGLSTVYGILKEHDAEIRCESQPGEGTQFFIRFPFQPQEARLQEVSEPEPCRILVVDDEPGILELVQQYLQSQGHQAEICGNGREALRRLTGDEMYDLVILDIWMPDFSGFQVWELLQAQAPNKQIAVIFMTGDADAELRERAAKLSAGFLAKPFTRKDLFLRIAESLKKNPPA